uniref:Uncharacterized protein n=1 Tax=Rhizophagus irregularis (strain DAOM 181602 / DAOM 197198 / MUCL 43194) TaxID=747089 RepID=U9TVP7_RHIID
MIILVSSDLNLINKSSLDLSHQDESNEYLTIQWSDFNDQRLIGFVLSKSVE